MSKPKLEPWQMAPPCRECDRKCKQPAHAQVVECPRKRGGGDGKGAGR